MHHNDIGNVKVGLSDLVEKHRRAEIAKLA
jgi:hypothetical protein